MNTRPPKDPRELAARALCRFHGVPEDTAFEGKPMWESYLAEVDAVLKAVGWTEPQMIPVYRMRQSPYDDEP